MRSRDFARLFEHVHSSREAEIAANAQPVPSRAFLDRMRAEVDGGPDAPRLAVRTVYSSRGIRRTWRTDEPRFNFLWRAGRGDPRVWYPGEVASAVYVSDELLADAKALEAMIGRDLSRRFAEKMDRELAAAIRGGFR